MYSTIFKNVYYLEQIKTMNLTKLGIPKIGCGLDWFRLDAG
jgi:hypothetical protein